MYTSQQSTDFNQRVDLGNSCCKITSHSLAFCLLLIYLLLVLLLQRDVSNTILKHVEQIFSHKHVYDCVIAKALLCSNWSASQIRKTIQIIHTMNIYTNNGWNGTSAPPTGTTPKQRLHSVPHLELLQPPLPLIRMIYLLHLPWRHFVSSTHAPKKTTLQMLSLALRFGIDQQYNIKQFTNPSTNPENT